MSRPAKIVYKPVGVAFNVLGAVVAGSILKLVRRHLRNEEEAPSATSNDTQWKKC